MSIAVLIGIALRNMPCSEKALQRCVSEDVLVQLKLDVP